MGKRVGFYIDGRHHEAEEGANLLQVVLSFGMNLPYFCWHPALGAVGACRQCAVSQFKDENDTRGRLIMACMTPVSEGLRVGLAHSEAGAFRKSIIEWLMASHPHDCPVCDEGGECHLQDMTVMSGHAYRRFRFSKRTFRNQYLGPFVTHEMNRCITCYRCVRFYGNYAGGTDLHAQAIRNHVYFGRHEEGALESEFSGNLVEVCPTGVFTDKSLSRHYARKWDLTTAPSVCVHCGVGCNTIPGARYGTLRRIRNRFHHEVNGYFLCDRGRYGYEFANGQQRLRQPLATAEGAMVPSAADAALQGVVQMMRGGRGVVGIGSPRASLEANFALRELVGADNFYIGLPAAEHALLQALLQHLQTGAAPVASLREVEEADALLLLGEDLPNTAPRLALSVRQATRNASFAVATRLGIPPWQDEAVRDATGGIRSPLFIATPAATRLDDVAQVSWRGVPDEVARLGYAIAHALDAGAPEVPGLPREMHQLAEAIAHTLAEAERPVILSGCGALSRSVLDAAAAVAHALHRRGRPVRVHHAVPECNSLGLALMGGGHLGDALEAVRRGQADTAVVLENDLFRRGPRQEVESLVSGVARLLVLDHMYHETVAAARWVLPVGTFAESSGTLVNSEGRAQRFFQVHTPEGPIRPAWRWLGEVSALHHGGPPRWPHLDAVTAACAAAIPALAAIPEAAPARDFRIIGQGIARQPPRYSGRTAMQADRRLHEPKPPEDTDTPLRYSMEGRLAGAPPALTPFYWAPGWNSAQALHRFQEEVGGPLRGGNAGVRLLFPAGSGGYPEAVPGPFTPPAGRWLLLPLAHVFGSEELSARAPAVAERMPPPTLSLHPQDAEALALEEGSEIRLQLGGALYRLAVSLRQDLVPGTAGLPVGFPGLEGIPLPVWTELTGGGSE